MTFDPRKPKYYDDIFDVYQDVVSSPRLSELECTFGKKSGQALGAIPRLRWETGKDRFSYGELIDHRCVSEDDDGANRLVHLQEHTRIDSAVTVYLFAENHAEIGRWRKSLLGALSDVLRATGAYQLGEGEEIEPGDDATQSWAYRLQLTVRLVCADTLPATYPQHMQATI